MGRHSPPPSRLARLRARVTAPVRAVGRLVRAVWRAAMAVLGVPLDWIGHVGSILWRSMFTTAAALTAAAGLLHAFGRVSDAYSAVLIAGALGAVGTFLALFALRVEPEVPPESEQPT